MSAYTKQAIKNSFLKLLNDRPLNQVTVKAIVEDCGINRNTFYYHFTDIPSLATEIITERADQIIRQYANPDSPEVSTTNGMFVFLLVFIVLLIGALSFFPALALGPVAEFFQMIA